MQRETVKQLLEKHGISPNKVLGQNFLTDQNTIHAFIDSAEISKKDTVVEVGPGTGEITKELAKRAGRVIAVEKDSNMVKILRDELKEYKNVEIIEEDILKFKMLNENQRSNPEKAITYKLIGAPPYYLTGRLFRKFLEEAGNKPELIAVIIQKEVAEKITAQPPRSNLLSISVQLYGVPGFVKKVPKGLFWPQPKVDSAILTVKNITTPAIDEKKFFRVLRAGFSSPRKQLLGNLAGELGIERQEVIEILKKHGISHKQRAETLSATDWKNIAKDL